MVVLILVFLKIMNGVFLLSLSEIFFRVVFVYCFMSILLMWVEFVNDILWISWDEVRVWMILMVLDSVVVMLIMFCGILVLLVSFIMVLIENGVFVGDFMIIVYFVVRVVLVFLRGFISCSDLLLKFVNEIFVWLLWLWGNFICISVS